MAREVWFEDDTPTPAPFRLAEGREPQADLDAAAVRTVKLLVVEDSRADFVLIDAYLSEVDGVSFHLEQAERLSQAVRRLAQGGIDLALVDLSLPDSRGMETFLKLPAAAPDVPMIVLTGQGDESMALAAIRHGAQDYLVKGMEPALLVRSIRYAVARHRSRSRVQRALLQTQVSEANLRTVITQNVDGLLILDHARHVLFANPAAERLLGRSGPGLVGQVLNFPVTPGTANEIEIPQPDGRRRTVEMRVVGLTWHGQPAYLASLRDLTHVKEVEAVHAMLCAAQEIQQGLLPRAAPRLPNFDIAGATFPAQQTGGDFFEYFSAPDGRVTFVVADISDHGFGPAILAADVHAYLKALAQREADTADILALTNRLLYEDTQGEHFATVLLARLDPRTRAMTYSGAGHPAGFVLDASGAVRARLESQDIPLGIEPHHQFHPSASVTLEPGDLVLLVTDGVAESTGPDGTLFGINRTLEVVRSHRREPADQIVAALCDAVREYSRHAEQRDDITAVVIKLVEARSVQSAERADSVG